MDLKETLKNIGLYIWQLPQNLVALVMYPFLGKKTLIKKEHGVRAYSAENMRGGISLGNYIFIDPRMALNKTTVAHEFGHTVDSRMMGWFYLFIIGLPSLCWAAFKPKGKCYYSFYTEKRANKHAGLEVAQGKYGCWLRFPEPVKIVEPKDESISSAISKIANMK